MSTENAGGAAGEPQGGSSEAAQPPAGWDRRQTEDAGRAQRVRKHQETHTLTHTNQLWGCNSTAGGRRWEIRGEISQGNPQMCSGFKDLNPFYTNPDLFWRAQAMSRYTHIPILTFPSALRVGISTQVVFKGSCWGEEVAQRTSASEELLPESDQRSVLKVGFCFKRRVNMSRKWLSRPQPATLEPPTKHASIPNHIFWN